MCAKCCTDTKCEIHEQQRQKAIWKENVLQGKTDIQLAAAEKRRLKLPKGRFKEPAFRYLGDTVIIWDIRQCLLPEQFPKQQQSSSSCNFTSSSLGGMEQHQQSSSMNSTVVEEILNRARKRNRLTQHNKVLRNNKKRFRRVIEDLYHQSLRQQE
jgi:hypothetical protein